MMAKRGRPEAISKITCMNDPKKKSEKITKQNLQSSQLKLRKVVQKKQQNTMQEKNEIPALPICLIGERCAVA